MDVQNFLLLFAFSIQSVLWSSIVKAEQFPLSFSGESSQLYLTIFRVTVGPIQRGHNQPGTVWWVLLVRCRTNRLWQLNFMILCRLLALHNWNMSTSNPNHVTTRPSSQILSMKSWLMTNWKLRKGFVYFQNGTALPWTILWPCFCCFLVRWSPIGGTWMSVAEL